MIIYDKYTLEYFPSIRENKPFADTIFIIPDSFEEMEFLEDHKEIKFPVLVDICYISQDDFFRFDHPQVIFKFKFKTNNRFYYGAY